MTIAFRRERITEGTSHSPVSLPSWPCEVIVKESQCVREDEEMKKKLGDTHKKRERERRHLRSQSKKHKYNFIFSFTFFSLSLSLCVCVCVSHHSVFDAFSDEKIFDDYIKTHTHKPSLTHIHTTAIIHTHFHTHTHHTISLAPHEYTTPQCKRASVNSPPVRYVCVCVCVK